VQQLRDELKQTETEAHTTTATGAQVSMHGESLLDQEKIDAEKVAAEKRTELGQIQGELSELTQAHERLKQTIVAQKQTLQKLRLANEALARELETQGTYTAVQPHEDQKETGGLDSVSAEDNEQEMQLRVAQEEQSNTAGPSAMLSHEQMAPKNNNIACNKALIHDSDRRCQVAERCGAGQEGRGW
jgi:hypothetical protein